MRYSAFLLIALSLAGFVGCSSPSTKKQSETPSTQVPSEVESPDTVAFPPDSPMLKQIRVDQVSMIDLPASEVPVPGKIELDPNRVSRVPLPAAGRVAEVLIKLGDYVRAGQPLLTIESSDAGEAHTAYLQSQSAIRQSEAAVVQAKSTHRKAQSDLDRITDLFQHDAVARKEVLNAENELTQTKAAVEQAEASLAQAKTGHEQTRRRLTMLGLKPGEVRQRVTMRSPLTGTVTEISVVAGEFRSDTAAPVFTIADMRRLWLVADVPEISLRSIVIGKSVEVNLDAYPNEVLQGRVARISDSLDPKTRTLKVMVELNIGTRSLRPEMFGRVMLSSSLLRVPALPVGAVIQDGETSVVYIEQSAGTFKRREVRTGNRFGEMIGVTEGVSEGDRVVTDGAILLMKK